MLETKGKLALSGVNVLDLTQGVAGPHATQLMVQSGAEVTKIEPVEGDWCRTLGRQYGNFTAHSIAFNRGKKSVAVNLKDPEVLRTIREETLRADVIAESFRPGVMARLGLDYETIARGNPDVVYLSLSGFGQTGPYKNRPVTDAVIQAFSGWMSINKSRDGVPQRSGMVAMDVMTGLYAFQAVLTALIRRDRFGGGQWIDCSLMQSAIAFQAAKVIEYDLQNGDLGNLYAPVGAFETADGIINITTMRDDHFVALCKVLEVANLVEDPRFVSRAARIANEPALVELLEAAFAKKPAAEWSRLLSAADVMNSVVQTYGDLQRDPQVVHVGAFETLHQPTLGSLPLANVPASDPVLEASPEIGAHTAEFLASHGLTSTLIDALASKGAIRLDNSDSNVERSEASS